MIEPTLAALVLALCIAMLARMALPYRQQARLDAALRRRWDAARALMRRLVHGRALRRRAERAADEAIRRARRDGRKPH